MKYKVNTTYIPEKKLPNSEKIKGLPSRLSNFKIYCLVIFILGLTFGSHQSLMAQTTVVRSITLATDDCEEEGTGTVGTLGNMNHGSSDIELTEDNESPSTGSQKVGFRFTSLNIPQGATITNSYLTFRAITADSPMTNSQTTNLTIRGHKSTNAPTFSTTNFDITNRTGAAGTTASASWSNVSSWTTGSDYNSPSLNTVIQELVNQGGWTTSSPIALIITGSGHRATNNFESGNTPAKLTITYTTAPPITITSTVTDESCAGANDGAINITTSGGTPPYNYIWNDGPTSEDRTGLADGAYMVNVTDAASVVGSASFTVNAGAGPTLSLATTQESVQGAGDGAINLTVSGATPPVSFQWKKDGVNFAATEDINNLGEGNYTVVVTDGCPSTTTISGSIAQFVIKQLYLSDPSQALDRIDPVASADGTTAQTTTMTLTSGSTSTDLVSIADNNLWEGQTSYNFGASSELYAAGSITDRDHGLIKFDLSGIPSNATITSASLQLTRKDGSTNSSRIIDLHRVTSDWIEGTVNSDSGGNGVSNWIQRLSSPATNWTTVGGDYNATVSASTSVAGNAAYTWSGAGMISLIQNWVNGTNQNYGMLIKYNNESFDDYKVFGSREESTSSRRPRLSVSYTVAGNTSTTFTQAPALCSPLTIKAGQTITVANYVSILSGSMPANPSITAVLKYGATNIITLSSPTYSGGLLTWTGTLGSDVTIPAGQAIALQVTTAQSGVTFKIDYDSQTKPSKIELPVTTYININSYAAYDAPYPGGNIITSGNPSDIVYLRAVVADPFGATDITGLNINITPPGSTVAATLKATAGCTRTYEYAWNTTGASGTVSVPATAKEGYEGTVTDVQTLNFAFCTPLISTPVFASGATSTRCQGAGNVIYSSNSTNSTGITYSLDAITAAFSGNSINTNNGRVTYATGWSGTSTITATATGCGGPKTATHTVTTTPTVGTPVFNLGPTSIHCKADGNVTYTATATNSTSITYSLNFFSLLAGNSINSSTGEVTYTPNWTGTSTITATAAGCNGPTTANHVVTINSIIAVDDSAFGYTGEPLLLNLAANDLCDVDDSSITITTDPIKGSVQIGTGGNVTYLPNGAGVDQFTYTICSNFPVVCDEATVVVIIEEDLGQEYRGHQELLRLLLTMRLYG